MNKCLAAIKNFKWGNLLFSLLFAGAGIAFIAFPQSGLKLVKDIIAGVAIAFALFYMVLTLAKKERGFTFACRMLMSCMCVLCGVLVFFVDNTLLEYLITAFGVILIVDASFKIQTSILSKKYKSSMWWFMLFFAVLVLACGILLMKSKFDFSVTDPQEEAKVYMRASYLLGAGLVLDGFTNLLAILYIYFVERGARKEIMEQLQEDGVVPVVIETLQPAEDEGEVTDGTTATTSPKVRGKGGAVTPKGKGKGKGATTPKAKPKSKPQKEEPEEELPVIVLPQLEAAEDEEK